MILHCLVIPQLLPSSKLLAKQDHAQNGLGTTENGGKEGGEYIDV